MDTRSNQELVSFHDFVGAKLANGGANLLPEDVLDEWREQNPKIDDDIEAIEVAVADRTRASSECRSRSLNE